MEAFITWIITHFDKLVEVLNLIVELLQTISEGLFSGK
jgi:hypothetical protein